MKLKNQRLKNLKRQRKISEVKMNKTVDNKSKKVVYVCWNDKAHASGTLEWDSPIALQPDTVSCPNCGEVVRIMQKL